MRRRPAVAPWLHGRRFRWRGRGRWGEGFDFGVLVRIDAKVVAGVRKGVVLVRRPGAATQGARGGMHASADPG